MGSAKNCGSCGRFAVFYFFPSFWPETSSCLVDCSSAVVQHAMCRNVEWRASQAGVRHWPTTSATMTSTCRTRWEKSSRCSRTSCCRAKHLPSSAMLPVSFCLLYFRVCGWAYQIWLNVERVRRKGHVDQGSFRAGMHRNAVPVLFLITGTPFRSFLAYSCKI